MAEHEPEHAARAATVLLPHDYLTWLLGGGAVTGHLPTTDRGDASGTGYWSPARGTYRPDLLRLAFGRDLLVPDVVAPQARVGETAVGAVLAPGTGDNMAAALGVSAAPGDVVVSIGTSGTIFAVHHEATHDATGTIAGFADATGRFLPLVCTLNGALVLTRAATMLGVDADEFDALARSAAPGAEGLVLLPYFDGERTPNLPKASATLSGLRHNNATPANLARAAVEGLLCGLADGLDALREAGIALDRVILIGGGARSRAIQELAPGLLDAVIVVPAAGEYVADGALGRRRGRCQERWSRLTGTTRERRRDGSRDHRFPGSGRRSATRRRQPATAPDEHPEPRLAVLESCVATELPFRDGTGEDHRA